MMRSCILKNLFFLPIFFLAVSAWSEGYASYESQTEKFEEAYTRRSTVQARIGRFEGIFAENKFELDSKSVNMFFIFSRTPSIFFDYYDSTKKAVVLEFYDTKIGQSLHDPIREYPINKSSLEEYTVDLNKGIEGLKPDIRPITRLVFYSDFLFPYTIEVDEFSMINFKFDWNKEIEDQTRGAGYKRFNKIMIYTFLLLLIALPIYAKIEADL